MFKFGRSIDPHFKTYDSLISFAKAQMSRPLFRLQRHHVHPKNDGGDPKGETVWVTLYEHVLAHYLYAMEHPNVRRENLRACVCLFDWVNRNRWRFNIRKDVEDWLRDPDLSYRSPAAPSVTERQIPRRVPNVLNQLEAKSFKELSLIHLVAI
jgi:hypothetical protein